MVQYANNTSILVLYEACSAQTLSTDFPVEVMNNIYIFIEFYILIDCF